MYGNGYSMAIVLDLRSTATSLTGNLGAEGLRNKNEFGEGGPIDFDNLRAGRSN